MPPPAPKRDMPITVFDSRGLPSTSRERIEAAVFAGGRHSSAQYEAWILTDSRGTVRVIMTGSEGSAESFRSPKITLAGRGRR